ncbi:MAG: outer membrane beta-barrel domain-containing protein [Deltaproteobacteria bacterium]|nr:outer membrane beta-barrel domain-containing protein [Deltaproteobacteria bacterium]
MNRIRIWVLVITGLMLSWGQIGWCEDQDEEEKVYAVQNKLFHRYHEIDFLAGYAADDDFFHLYPLGIGYTYHLNEHLSWEVARVQYMFTQDKDLKETLESEFEVQPDEFSEPKYMIHTHAMFKPLYGKSAVLNRRIVNHEVYLLAGGGVVHYEWNQSSGETRSESVFSISVGAGMRYFLSEHSCINIEIRDLVNFRESDTKNNVMLDVGFGLRFNLGERRVEEDQGMKRLKRILDED